MADTKISDLPAASGALAAQELVVNDAGTSKKLTVGQLAGLGTGGGYDVSIADTNYVTLASVDMVIAAGDSVIVECQFVILNNSGTARTYTVAVTVGAFVVEVVDGATMAASATNRSFAEFLGSAGVWATNLAYGGARLLRMTTGAANTPTSGVLAQIRSVWNTTTSDLTGSVVPVAVKIKANAATATQTAHVLSFRIRKV